MNLKLIFFFYILTLSSSSISQYSEYMKFINSAEEQLISGDLNKAVLYYDSAFIKNDFPMPKDLHNQIEALIKTRNFTLAKDKIELLLTKYNISPNHFKRYSKYISKEKLKTYKINYDKKINTNDFMLVDSLCKIDQEIRTNENYLNFPNKIRSVDSITFQVFCNRILPSFQNGKLNSSFFFRKMNFEPDVKVYVLVRHWFQQKFENTENVFLSLVETMNFPPEVFAELIDVKNGQLENSSYGFFTEIEYEKRVKNINRTPDQINSINFNRQKIYLPLYERYLDILDFDKSEKSYLFYNLNRIIFTGNKAFKVYFEQM